MYVYEFDDGRRARFPGGCLIHQIRRGCLNPEYPAGVDDLSDQMSLCLIPELPAGLSTHRSSSWIMEDGL